MRSIPIVVIYVNYRYYNGNVSYVVSEIGMGTLWF